MNGKSNRYDKLEDILQDGRCPEPHNLPLKYLRDITNNFSDERLLGEGGFGTVYKGVLQNGEMIAVKKLHSSIPGVKGRHFENEANHLMRLKHPNVVLLVGWCFENEKTYTEYNGKYIWAEKLERLLCLEYMPKGNLRAYLSDECSGLGWDTRYKIIEGICYGLHYLHEEWQLNARIVHMDLKPANILLDNKMTPKIADFGLSRLFSEEKTWTCTISRDGTLGYMSPEYIKKGLISTKSDIFSLGVIIIEIVTGHRDYPDETGTSSKKFIETVLNNWRQRNRVENLCGHVSLEVEYQQIRKCIQIGLDCVKIDRFQRPTISQIIKTLHGLGSAYSSNIKANLTHETAARREESGSSSMVTRSGEGDASITGSRDPQPFVKRMDDELILHYLRNRAASAPCPVPIIADVDIYKFDPWDLPAKALYGDGEYYFFSPRDRKYPNGVRPNRAAGSGYWKATGTDKPIHDAATGEAVGVKKALVFYKGRPPRGSKTNWIMHEYRLAAAYRPPSKFRNVSMRLDDWVLCRIYKKSSQASPMVPPLADYEHLDHDEPSHSPGGTCFDL